jgi:hypothetical protein
MAVDNLWFEMLDVSDGRWDYAKGYLLEEDALAAIEELRRSGVPSP